MSPKMAAASATSAAVHQAKDGGMFLQVENLESPLLISRCTYSTF